MAPEASHPKRKARENQYPFELGVKGRKTGITLPELGERDENGMEPMDHLFSSPEKPKKNQANQRHDTTLSEEEDMEFGESSTPGPIEALAERQKSNARLPIPKSKTPIKTYLQSPARRNAAIGSISSLAGESIAASKTTSKPGSVQRKLEFSKPNSDSRKFKPPIKQTSKKVSSSKPLPSKQINGHRSAKTFALEDYSDQDENSDFALDAANRSQEEQIEQNAEISVSDNEPDNGPRRKAQPRPVFKPRPKRGRTKGKEADSSESFNSKELKDKSDEIQIQAMDETDIEDISQKSKHLENSVGGAAASQQKNGKLKKAGVTEKSDSEIEHPNKRSRHSPMDSSPDKIGEQNRKMGSKSLKTRTKQKVSTAKLTVSTQSQPAPPLPKGKGLLILRHETVEDNKNILQTRSGRNSIKPLAFWSNEKVEFEGGELPTKDLTANFTGRKIKHVIRAEEIAQPVRKNRNKSRRLKSKKPKQAMESEIDEDSDLESWELDPGRIIADVRNWDPDDHSGSNMNEREEEIALSSSAIITRDIANASFRFAKTLTLPFFGAGMVDLPPGAEKKQKNSRKMQMAFFVFYGKVQVTVNDNVFRISKGGMWQVPRGNFYGIHNDYDKPARIFFSQGCEIEEDVEES